MVWYETKRTENKWHKSKSNWQIAIQSQLMFVCVRMCSAFYTHTNTWSELKITNWKALRPHSNIFYCIDESQRLLNKIFQEKVSYQLVNHKKIFWYFYEQVHLNAHIHVQTQSKQKSHILLLLLIFVDFEDYLDVPFAQINQFCLFDCFSPFRHCNSIGLANE